MNDMLKAEVIEESESPWSSGVVLVNKKRDGGGDPAWTIEP